VALLDEGAIAGQAVGAVAGGAGQDPVLLDEDAVDGALAAGEVQVQRRVAAGEAGQGQCVYLVGGEPGGACERFGHVRSQGEHAAGGDGGGLGGGQSGDGGQAAWGQVEAVGQAQQVAGQRLVG
jgi:hypothetical protein